MGRTRGAVVVVVLLLLAGCTTIAGQAEPAGPPAPTRPREIRIDGVDPCSLLTDAQRAELGLDAQPRLDVGPLPPYPGTDIPLCLFGGFEPRAISLTVATVTTAGVDLFLSDDVLASVQPIEVSGFPALIAIAPRNPDFCTVVVDVAAGHTLDISFGLDGQGSGTPVDLHCRDAKTAATAAMSTLLTQR